MSPSSRAALPGRLTTQARWDSPLGGVLLARTADGLAGLWFDGQKDHPGPLTVREAADDPLLRAAIDQLGGYFAGRVTTFTLPLDLCGTPFQRAVWQALLGIAAGRTCSYRDIAEAVGSPAAVRAVGAAVGRNPVSVIVPCHRVIGRDGSLTGYAGGLDRKRALLALEAGPRGDGVATEAVRAASGEPRVAA
jgi:methylated-DNA-[protein]-cysteine S-methyltransferase